jgi:hypothetical protein
MNAVSVKPDSNGSCQDIRVVQKPQFLNNFRQKTVILQPKGREIARPVK